MIKVKTFFYILAASLLLGAAQSCSSSDDSDDSTTAYNKRNKEAGESFLIANRDSAGVKETYTGLQYRVDSLGTGVKPDENDSVYVDFTGQLCNGTYFTSATNTALLVSEQIAGMQEGLELMPEGSVFDLYIPYFLAYKAESNTYYYKGNMVSISAYSMLHFRVRLRKVVQIASDDN